MAVLAGTGELELGLLRTFLAVVRRGSITKAAAAMEKAQPTLTRQIAQLEKIVGQQLFDRARGSNGVTLTRHGELLVGYANRAIELSEETLTRLRGQSAAGQLVVGVSADLPIMGLISALKRLQSGDSELALKVVVTVPKKLDGLLRAGELDLAIATPGVMTGVPSVKWQTQLQWAAAKSLRISKSRALPLVLFESHCHWQDEMLDSLQRAGWQWRVAFESSGLDAVLNATQSGLGLAALPTAAVRSCRLMALEDPDLPSPPKVEFGMFPAPSLAGNTRPMLEAALESSFTDNRQSLVAEALHQTSKEESADGRLIH